MFFGVIWSIKGDLDWFFKGLGLKSYNRKDPCEFCGCSRKLPKNMWPTNFSAGALWTTNMFTPAQWLAMQDSPHALFQVFEFLSQHNLEADELHILHLGVSQYYLGSILYLLTYDCLAGSAIKNVNIVWEMILKEYEIQPGTTEYTKLCISSFVNPQAHDKHFPRLKGRGCEVKSLLFPLQSIWEKLKKTGRFYAKVSESFEAMTRVQNIIDEYKDDLFMPEETALELLEETNRFCQTYCWLANASARRHLMLFDVAPKLHWLWHMGFRARFLSVRRSATFIDEDFVKHMKKVWAQSVSGKPMYKVPADVLEKYRWGVSLQ